MLFVSLQIFAACVRTCNTILFLFSLRVGKRGRLTGTHCRNFDKVKDYEIMKLKFTQPSVMLNLLTYIIVLGTRKFLYILLTYQDMY